MRRSLVGGGGAKIAWRLITADKQYGKMKFGSLFGANPMVDDGEYCFALMPDYGTVCKAVSERLAVKARKVVSVVADSGLFADAGGSIHRQDRQKSASLGLISVNKVAERRERQTVIEHPPVRTSGSNDIIERGVKDAERRIRRMKSALDNKLGTDLSIDANVVPWMIEYASVLLNRYSVGRDGETPFERLKGGYLSDAGP